MSLGGCVIALPQGINLRSTAAFVTDGSDEDFEGPNVADGAVNADTYPRTSAQGNTVGWEGTDASGNHGTRNRNSGVDRRCAGVHFMAAGQADDFRIDLPATGSYAVRVAAGDNSYSVDTKIELLDTTTSLAVLCSGSTGAAASFKDATDVTRTSAADWVTNNASATHTFSTTICRFRCGDSVGVSMAHLYIESAGAVANTRVYRLPLMGAG